jgi:lysyl-tRNA synthetase, class II
LFRHLCDEVVGCRQVDYQGTVIDFEKPFTRISIKESILRYHPEVKASELETVEACWAILDRLELPYKKTDALGKLQMIVFELPFRTVAHSFLN